MTAPISLAFPLFRAFSSAGVPLAGGKVEVYLAGTTTPATSYTTQAGTVPNAWPVVLDANGQAEIWLPSTNRFKITLKNSADAVQPGFPIDNFGAETVENTQLATMAAYTVKGNDTAIAAIPQDLTMAELRAILALTLTELPAQAKSYDLSFYYIGKPTNSLVLFRHKAARAFSIPATTHQGVSGVSATASAVVTFKKNGTDFGTATFAISGTVPTFAVTATTFAAGDVITAVAQASADATLSDIAITLFGTVV